MKNLLRPPSLIRSTLAAGLACLQVACASPGDRWQNPEGSPPDQSSWRDVASLWWGFITASREQTQPPAPAGHVVPREAALAGLSAQQRDARDSLTWLGHASFLLCMGGKVVLTDPFLSEAASPFSSIGPKRFAGPGLAAEDLPPVDVVVISHNHYDHLDLRTLQRLPGKASARLVVPSGVGPLVRGLGFLEVHELRWGEALQVGALRVAAAPVVHFSGAAGCSITTPRCGPAMCWRHPRSASSLPATRPTTPPPSRRCAKASGRWTWRWCRSAPMNLGR
jgi:hypothetical protein